MYDFRVFWCAHKAMHLNRTVVLVMIADTSLDEKKE